MARWVDLDRYDTMYCPKGMTKGSDQCNKYNNCDDCYVDYFKDEVAPIVHAKWKILENDYAYDDMFTYECSNCLSELCMVSDDLAPYCHNCGAKMDKD